MLFMVLTLLAASLLKKTNQTNNKKTKKPQLYRFLASQRSANLNKHNVWGFFKLFLSVIMVTDSQQLYKS